jgi:hypothetical protein
VTSFETVLPLTLDKAEAKRQYLREWRAKNKEKLQKYFKEYYVAHAEEKRAATKAWRKNNPERFKQNTSAYKKRHRRALNEKQIEYRLSTPERQLDYCLSGKYGISLETYKDMVEAQGGLCLICGGPETRKLNGSVLRLSVDHCHETGNVRGLLCASCNKGIGLLGDDPARLLAAIDYLARDTA